MINMFKTIFSFITIVFRGAERYANAFDQMGVWAEESAKSMADEARIERQLKLAKAAKDRAAAEAKAD